MNRTMIAQRLANGLRYAVGAAAGLAIAMGAGQAPAPAAAPTAHVVSTSAAWAPPHRVSLPKPGKVLTSTGRKAGMDKHGCIFLTYAELGAPEAGDPGDGEKFCAK